MSLIAVRMPKWGLAMHEGTITAWHVTPGQAIERGSELCDIETAKIVNAFEAPAAGVLARVLPAAGDVVTVGHLIAVLATAGETADEVDALVRAERREVAAAPPEAAITLRRVATSSGDLAYAETGPPDAPPVVLLHGFGGDHSGWTLTQEALAAEFRVLAFDLPGHGASTRSVGTGSATAVAAPLAEALDRLRVGPVHLVAHSFGAMVARALLAAGTATATTSLIAPAGFGAAVDREYVQGFVASRRKRELRPLMERLFAHPEHLGREMVSAALALLDDDATRAALRCIADQIASAGPGEAAWPDGGKLLLVLWGGRDRIVPLPDQVASMLGDRLYLLPESGHLPQLEEFALVNRQLLAFLAGHSGTFGTRLA